MTHFEYLESIGQTNIFEFLYPAPTIQIGDAAKINIDSCDDEASDYFKYYYPHILNKVGTIVDKKLLRDKTLYLIDVYGERHWVYETELVVL